MVGYEVKGIVDVNVMVEIWNVGGVVIGIGIVDGIGVFIVIIFVGEVGVNEMLIVVVKNVSGIESMLIMF